MEGLIVSLFEKSLVGGAFVYLLYFFVNKFNITLLDVATTLKEVSGTLSSMDARMTTLEEEVKNLKGESQ